LKVFSSKRVKREEEETAPISPYSLKQLTVNIQMFKEAGIRIINIWM